MSTSKNRLPNPGFAVVDPSMPVNSFTDSTLIPTAKGWFIESKADGGTPIALAVSQQAFSLSQVDIPGEPKNYLQMVFSSAGANLGPGSFLKFCTRLNPQVLNGYYATFSFWMKSNVLGRPIYMVIRRNYGTGGSPSPDDVFPITYPLILATLGWQRFALDAPILPINDGLNPRVFGTDNNAFLELALYFQAGSTASVVANGFVSPASDTLLLAQPQFERGILATKWVDGDVGGGYVGAYTGVINLGNGVDQVTVTGANLPFTPSDVRFTVRKAGETSPGNFNLFPTLKGTPTKDGFVADLNGLTDASTYQLGFEYVP